MDMLHELFVEKISNFHGRRTPPIMGNLDREPRIHLFQARGARWKTLRGIANSVFPTNNFKMLLPTLNDSVEQMMNFIDEAHDKGSPSNIHPYFRELTMDIIARVSMGQKKSLQWKSDYAPLAKRVFEQLGTGTFIYLSWLAHGLTPLLRRIGKMVDTLTGAPIVLFYDKIEKAVDQ